MDMNNAPTELVIFSYTRRQAIEDGVLWEASAADQDKSVRSVCAQHVPGCSVATTMPVFEIMRKSVENQKWGTDYAGILHDMFCMARMRPWQGDTKLFKVIIMGAGRQRYFIFKVQKHPDEAGRPCVTFMLPEED